MKKIILGIIIGILLTYLSFVIRLYQLNAEGIEYSEKTWGKEDCVEFGVTSFRYSNYWTFFPDDFGGLSGRGCNDLE